MRATSAEMTVRDAQPSTLPSFSASHLSADFFHQLARANLTAVGYQVLFWHMERMIRHRVTSEAVPLEIIAKDLHLHRNAVGKAYVRLMAAGLVRRQEVPQRGAPTRTWLEGIALQMVQQPPGKRDPSGPITGRFHTTVPTGTGRKSDLSQLGQQNATRGLPPHTRMEEPATPQTASLKSDSTTGNTRVSAASPELLAQALAKLPYQARYAALQGTLVPSEIESDWGLSEEEKASVLDMKRREVEPPIKPTSCMKPVPTKAPQAITAALLQHRAQFDALVEDGALSQLGQAELDAMAETGSLTEALMDQIAFMICKCGLGRGDVYQGVRAARSLVAKGRWTLPWSFTRDWYGAVLRGTASDL
jgi:hypothetical protein